jgi:hypothetical protein
MPWSKLRTRPLKDHLVVVCRPLKDQQDLGTPAATQECTAHMLAERVQCMGPLKSHAVLKALDWLDRQQRSERVDQLHKLVEQWRAAGDMDVAREQCLHLRHVAATFYIPLGRNVSGRAATVSSKIGRPSKRGCRHCARGSHLVPLRCRSGWNDDRSTRILDFARAAQDSLAQRAGRVGRTKPGLVLRMLTRAEHAALPFASVPEMLRERVAHVILKSICMSSAGGNSVDAEAEVQASPSPPRAEHVAEALQSVEDASAIQETSQLGKKRWWKPLQPGIALEDLPVGVGIGVIAVHGLMIGAEACAAEDVAMIHAHNVVGGTLRDGGPRHREKQGC